MRFLEFLNARSRRLSFVDWKMAQGAVICLTLIVVKLFPNLMELDIRWLVAGLVVLYVRPLYVFYLRNSR